MYPKKMLTKKMLTYLIVLFITKISDISRSKEFLGDAGNRILYSFQNTVNLYLITILYKSRTH